LHIFKAMFHICFSPPINLMSELFLNFRVKIKNFSPSSKDMNIKEIIKQLEAIDNELDKREALMIEKIKTSTRRTKAEINSVLIALDNLEKK